MLLCESVYSITPNSLEKTSLFSYNSRNLAAFLPCWMIPYSWLYLGVSQRRDPPWPWCSGSQAGEFQTLSPCASWGMGMLREGISALVVTKLPQNSGFISPEARACSISGEVPGSENVEMLSDMLWVLCLPPTLFSYLCVPVTPELWLRMALS